MSETATRSVIVERAMAHPPEKIWRALTQAPLIDEWLMKTDFQLALGQQFELRTGPMPPHWDGVVHCKVLEIEPHRLLSYTWETTAGMKTVVTFRLTPSERGTMLRVEQSGFRADEEQNFQGARYGWERNLGNLERVAGSMSL